MYNIYILKKTLKTLLLSKVILVSFISFLLIINNSLAAPKQINVSELVKYKNIIPIAV